MLRSHRDDLELIAGTETGWEVAFPFLAMMALAAARNVSGRCPAELLESMVVFPSSKSSGGIQMATTSRGRGQDRAKVAAAQDHEVRYEARKEGVSKDTIEKVVKTAGNSRKKVEAEIGRR